MRIEFVASNMGSTAGAAYNVASVELLPRGNDPGDPVRSTWTSLLTVDASCSGTVVAPFTCGTSPVGGNVGSVFRYSNAPVSPFAGYVTWPVDFAGLSGRTISALIRHRVTASQPGWLVDSVRVRWR